jgi:hypothetical protein
MHMFARLLPSRMLAREEEGCSGCAQGDGDRLPSQRRVRAHGPPEHRPQVHSSARAGLSLGWRHTEAGGALPSPARGEDVVSIFFGKK